MFRECRPAYHFPLPCALFFFFLILIFSSYTQTDPQTLSDIYSDTPAIISTLSHPYVLIQKPSSSSFRNPHALESIPVSSHLKKKWQPGYSHNILESTFFQETQEPRLPSTHVNGPKKKREARIAQRRKHEDRTGVSWYSWSRSVKKHAVDRGGLH